MNIQTLHLPTDVPSGLLLAGSWCPVLLVAFSYDHVALTLSMIVTLLAIVEYCLKIYTRLSHPPEKEPMRRPDEPNSSTPKNDL